MTKRSMVFGFIKLPITDIVSMVFSALWLKLMMFLEPEQTKLLIEERTNDE